MVWPGAHHPREVPRRHQRYSGAATAVVKQHINTPTASTSHSWLSSLKALAESDTEFLPWAPESGTGCMQGVPAKRFLSGSHHPWELLGGDGLERSLCPLGS